MRRQVYSIPRQAHAKRWVTALALLAFLLQSLAVQTHFHPVLEPAGIKAATHVPTPAPSRNQAPIDQCRLCQELVHAGVFVTPSASSALAGPALTAAVFTLLASAPITLAAPFAWQSRAPPRR